jgi:hypothetical protein
MNSWTLFWFAPAEYTFEPSGCQTRPSQALSTCTVFFTIHLAMSTIVIEGLAMPSFVTSAYLPSGDTMTLNGMGPTGRLRPVGDSFHPFGSRIVPSACAPGAAVTWGGDV